MTTIYRSDDGKEFPTEEECLSWEEKVASLSSLKLKALVVDLINAHSAAINSSKDDFATAQAASISAMKSTCQDFINSN